MDYSPIVIQLRQHITAFYGAANEHKFETAKVLAKKINELSVDLLLAIGEYK